MEFLKKHAWIFLGLGIFTLYFFTRLYNILGLPIFTDEAIYVRWAQIASNDAAWRFISLTDGKQPMYVWIAMVLMKLIHDPLLAGRIVSVIAGFFSMIGLFFLTNEIFKNRKIALFTSFMYVIYPFSLVYDRMALYDSLVAMFIIWAIYFEILLVRHLRLDLALILGMIMGGGMLTKTHANFALILLPLSLLLFNFRAKNWKKLLGKWIIFALVAVFIANAMYLVLRLSPFFHIIETKNYVFSYQPQELLQAPFAYFLHNLSPLSDWVIKYMTLPFLVLVVASFLTGKKYLKEKLLLLAWFILPIVATAFIGRLLYPRFILFMTIPLLILGTYALYQMVVFAKKIWLKIIICVVFLMMFVVNDFYIITDLAKAKIPRSDLGQFIVSWPSGGGVKETIDYLTEKSKTEKIYVGTEGTFGLMPYALEMYFINNPNVTIKAFWPVNDTMPEEVITASKSMPTYFVFYQPCSPCARAGIAPKQWPVTQIFQIKKLEKEVYYTLYQVK
jgi:4-amino-4-deoxy-L-arabinose transferase-like glycosyltransferase